MKSYISEAARAANAMEGVADTLTENTTIDGQIIDNQRTYAAMQMRAYLSVLIGNAIYQERDKNVKFSAMPVMHNSGNTPAHNISYWQKSNILPVPLPETFVFDSAGLRTQHSVVLPPHQQFTLNCPLVDFVDDKDVVDIMSGATRALYVWGVITYEDEFKSSHTTKFCQYYAFSMNHEGRVILSGFFHPRHNESD